MLIRGRDIADRLYTRSHEWVSIEQNTVTVGITDHAQGELGDVVFVELPAEGATVEIGKVFGVIESVKAASELFSPASGQVIAVNAELSRHPELVNKQPYDEGWLIKVRLSGGLPDDLLGEAEYQQLLANSGH